MEQSVSSKAQLPRIEVYGHQGWRDERATITGLAKIQKFALCSITDLIDVDLIGAGTTMTGVFPMTKALSITTYPSYDTCLYMIIVIKPSSKKPTNGMHGMDELETSYHHPTPSLLSNVQLQQMVFRAWQFFHPAWCQSYSLRGN